MSGKKNKQPVQGISWKVVGGILVSIATLVGFIVNGLDFINYLREGYQQFLWLGLIILGVVWLIILWLLFKQRNVYGILWLAVTVLSGAVIWNGWQSYNQTNAQATQQALLVERVSSTQSVQATQTAQSLRQSQATQHTLATQQVMHTQQVAATATQQSINQAREEKLILLITNFDGPEDVYGIRNELVEELRQAVQNYDDTEIVTIEEVVTPALGSKYALELGYKNQADLVIWAWYRPTEMPNVTIHVENLSPEQFTVSGFSVIQESELHRPDTNLAELESFEFQKQLGSETTNLVNFLLGNIQYKHKNWKLALDRFEQVLSSSEETLIVGRKFILLYTGLCYYYLDQPLQALSYYDQAIQIDPLFTKPYNNKGVVFNNLEQYEDALETLNKAIRIDPNYTLAYINRGTAHYGTGQYQKAMDDYSKAIELNSKIPAGYYGRGNVYRRYQEYEKAIAEYDQAIELYSKYVDAYLNRGISYRDLGYYERSIEDFNRAIELNPNSMKLYANRGLAYYYLGEIHDAINDFNKAIELDPNYAEIYNYRGYAYFILNQYEDAIGDFTQAIQLSPELIDAYYNRAQVYLALGKTAEAEADFKKYEELTGEKP